MSNLTSMKELFEDYLNTCCDSFKGAKTINDAMTYSLKAGGKRIRPLLAMASHGSLSDDMEYILPMAASLEMIHTYSLIHDDLPAMDNDDLRRGRPTNHKVFGEAMAILAGDALLNEAAVHLLRSYARISDGAVAVLYIMEAAGSEGMISGQVLDIEGEGRPMEMDYLERMHRLKTGALIRAAVTAPVILAGRDDLVEGYEVFGDRLGLLFQIQDDILDCTSTDEVMGKTVGKDSRDDKSTYVSIHGLDKAKELLKETYDLLLEDLERLKAGESLRELVDNIYRRDS